MKTEMDKYTSQIDENDEERNSIDGFERCIERTNTVQYYTNMDDKKCVVSKLFFKGEEDSF